MRVCEKNIHTWVTGTGTVSLNRNIATGALNAKFTESDGSECVCRNLSGIPQRISNSEAMLTAYLKDTYVTLSGKQVKSINVLHRGLGGMFNPKVAGGFLGALAGREAVYQAGRAMGHSDLHIAATQGWDSEVARLVEEGADLNRVGPKGNTPLDDAIQFGNTSVEATLREAGAKRKSELGSEPGVSTSTGTSAAGATTTSTADGEGGQ